MSLNKFTDTTTGFDLKLDAGFDEVKVNDLEVLGNLTVGGDTIIPAENLTYGVAVGLETKTIVDTGLESTLYPPTIAGSLTIPANTMKKGDSYHAHFTGLFRDATVGGNNIDFLVNMNSGVDTITVNTLTYSSPGGIADTAYTLDVYYTVREIGVAGVAKVATSAVFTLEATPFTPPIISNFSNTTTFDTTLDQDLLVLADWTSASADSEIRGYITTLTKIF